MESKLAIWADGVLVQLRNCVAECRQLGNAIIHVNILTQKEEYIWGFFALTPRDWLWCGLGHCLVDDGQAFEFPSKHCSTEFSVGSLEEEFPL